MESTVTLHKNAESIGYVCSNTKNAGLKMLTTFLEYEVWDQSEYVKNELSSEHFFSGNTLAVERIGSTIRVFDIHDKTKSFTGIDAEGFDSILDGWRDAVSNNAQKITVTMNAEHRYTLTAE